MKTIHIMKNLSLIVLISLVLLSCEKKYETADISKITYYPAFEVTGAAVILKALNSTYTEPGIKAIENGQEITIVTTVIGTIQGGSSVNTAIPDEYLISYSATNSDGFVGNAERKVWVAGTGDLVTSIEGLYTSTVVRNGASGAAYTNMKYILIYKTGANTYKISDGIGGYYDLGRAYGPDYRAAAGNITATDIPTNNFAYPATFGVGVFGGAANMSGLTVTPATKRITFSTSWDAGYTFAVTLTQVNI